MLRIPEELVRSNTNESLAEILSDLPDEQSQSMLASLSDDEQEWINHSWQFWGRPKQQPPDNCDDPECGCGGDWTTWLILSGRAWGKALDLEIPVPTPTGWTKMGDIKVGDRVFDENGKPCSVTHAFDVMYGRPCYKITFDDRTEITADAEHEWVTSDKLARKRGRPAKIRTTEQIAETLKYMGESNHSIGVCGPLRLREKRLPIDPYVLGAWLGDGTSASGSFTFVDADAEIADRIGSAGFEVNKLKYRYSWGTRGLRVHLRRAGLLNNKHIPKKYLRASIAQRTALLQGLMDTDGTVDKAGKCEFCSTNENLASGVLELLTGLGVKASMSVGRATLYGRDTGPKYRIHFYRPNIEVFHLRRKAERLRAAGPASDRVRRSFITNVERCESVPVRCIKVDSPSSLFLVSKAMIPTHNSRTGSEWVHEVAHKYPGSRIAVVAPTARSARQVMIEGESGILGTQKPWNKCRYWPAKLEITFANGSLCGIFSADEPERLRGPQHHFAWCDELCAWPKADDVWNMLRLGLRLPMRSGWPKYSPRVVITTTPKPTELIRKLAGVTTKGKSKRTHVTRGSTYENKSNLDHDYFESVISDLKGTRLGQQELYGAILIDTPGAIWKSSMIDPFRVDPEQIPVAIKNCVIAVDPSAGGDNETGIIACAVGPSPVAEGVDLDALDDHPSIAASLKKNQRLHGYVLADNSLHGASPDQWARAAVRAYHEFDASCIVAESNQGGDMVRYTINTVDSSVPVKLVHATRGKKTRAEPVAALFEQGRIHIVGRLTKLEEQLLTWDPEEGKSPDRLDAMVWGLHHLLGKGKIHTTASPIQIGVRPNPWAIIP